MNIDIDGLIELAKKASEGPWLNEEPGQVRTDFYMTDDGDEVADHVGSFASGSDDPDNAAFVAAANPAVILALCERLREAESAMKLSLKLLQDGEVDSAIDQIEEALNPEVSDE